MLLYLIAPQMSGSAQPIMCLTVVSIDLGREAQITTKTPLVYCKSFHPTIYALGKNPISTENITLQCILLRLLPFGPMPYFF